MKELTLYMAKKAGFCFGVTRVVSLITQALDQSADNKRLIYGLGWPIHNTRLVSELQNSGLKIISNLDEIDDFSKATLVIRAHGEHQSVLERIKTSSAKLLDATCPLVARIRQQAVTSSEQGRNIICIGSSGHPEVQGILSCASNPAVAFLAGQELPDWDKNQPVAVVTQSTITKTTFEAALAELKAYFTDLQCFDLRCNAVEMRQKEAVEMASRVDLMLVIGSKVSANSCHLADLCQDLVMTWQLDDVSQLGVLPDDVSKIGITAGSSTPPIVIEEIVSELKKRFAVKMADESMTICH